MLVHNLSPETAAALKSLTNQIHCNHSIKPEESRKTKRRVYPKKYCPVTGYSKIALRMESLLREIHKVSHDKIYKKLLRETIMQQDLEAESECSTTGSEDEYRKFKKILKRRGGKYLARTKANVKVSDDSSDEDWLHQCLKQKRFRKSKLTFLIKTVCNSLHLSFTFQSLLCFVFKNIFVDIIRSR